MPEDSPDRRELGHYFALAQVGTEMVAPVVLGLLLDSSFGWQPWGVVVGAAFGLIAGLMHLVAIANRQNRPGPGDEKQEQP